MDNRILMRGTVALPSSFREGVVHDSCRLVLQVWMQLRLGCNCYEPPKRNNEGHAVNAAVVLDHAAFHAPVASF